MARRSRWALDRRPLPHARARFAGPRLSRRISHRALFCAAIRADVSGGEIERASQFGLPIALNICGDVTESFGQRDGPGLKRKAFREPTSMFRKQGVAGSNPVTSTEINIGWIDPNLKCSIAVRFSGSLQLPARRKLSRSNKVSFDVFFRPMHIVDPPAASGAN